MKTRKLDEKNSEYSSMSTLVDLTNQLKLRVMFLDKIQRASGLGFKEMELLESTALMQIQQLYKRIFGQSVKADDCLKKVRELNREDKQFNIQSYYGRRN